MPEFLKPELLDLKSHPELNEKWVQDRIAEDPSMLGLGDLILKDRERSQPKAGRLDLLLQEPETQRRFEVEVQLGRCDESHIIRTVEYWDVECKRYPQYDHCAVLVAEDITSRFLNVISLFNGSIPLVAIRMQALKLGNQVTLIFTTVIDEMPRGLVDEDETEETVDRSWWEKKRPKEFVALADDLLKLVHDFDPGWQPKYNKGHISVEKDGLVSRFVRFRPRANDVLLRLKLEKSEEVTGLIEQSGLDAMDYRFGTYRLRLRKKDIEENAELLRDLMNRAYEANK